MTRITKFLKPTKQKLIIWVVLLIVSSMFVLGSLQDVFGPDFIEPIFMNLGFILSFLLPPSMVADFPLLAVGSIPLITQSVFFPKIMLIGLLLYTYILACLISKFIDFIKLKKVPRKILGVVLIIWVAFSFSIFFPFYALLGAIPLIILLTLITKYLSNFNSRVSLIVLIISLYVIGTVAFISLDFFKDQYCEGVVKKSGSENYDNPNMSYDYQLSQKVREECYRDYKLIPNLLKYFQEEVLKSKKW